MITGCSWPSFQSQINKADRSWRHITFWQFGKAAIEYYFFQSLNLLFHLPCTLLSQIFNGICPGHFNGKRPVHFEGACPGHFNGTCPGYFNGTCPAHFNGTCPAHFIGVQKSQKPFFVDFINYISLCSLALEVGDVRGGTLERRGREKGSSYCFVV